MACPSCSLKTRIITFLSCLQKVMVDSHWIFSVNVDIVSNTLLKAFQKSVANYCNIPTMVEI